MEQEKQKLEYEKRLTQSKEKVESIMENIRQGIEYKHLMNIKRFNEIMEQRESKLKQRQEQNYLIPDIRHYNLEDMHNAGFRRHKRQYEHHQEGQI